MTAKHQRLVLAAVALCGVAGAGVLAASALRDEAAYFRTPAEVVAGKTTVGTRVEVQHLAATPPGMAVRAEAARTGAQP